MEAAVGTERFEVTTLLGEGGMGVVYSAWDKVRGQHVALKTLRVLDPVSVLRFKQEFRTILDLRHPNLVTIGELIESDGRLMFTMELVTGLDFRQFASLGPKKPTRRVSEPELTTVRAIDARIVRTAPETVTAPTGFDAKRLRSALTQLASALMHLHDAGVVHRDVKPSNVLVTEEGRVVLLDFGVAARSHDRDDKDTALAGTPEYMAPEMLAGRIGPESDLYAVGVMLYEVLAGSRPFEGAPALVLAQKAARDPVRPSVLRRDVPEDLDGICMALLSRDPDTRLTARALHASLTRVDTDAPRAVGDVADHEPELNALRALAAEVRASGPRIVTIEGASGVGKSALIASFAEGEAGVVLSGRCREQEAIPYRAFDGVIDALARVIAGDTSIANVHCPSLSDAAVMFPVLGPLAHDATRGESIVELGEARRRAFSGVRSVLAHIARTGPLLVCIDDAQCADEDSAALLDALLDGDDAPRALFVIAYRSVTTAHPFSTTIRKLEGHVPRTHISLALTQAASITRARLEDEMLSRLDALDPSARRLLDVVVVASYPIDVRVACGAAQVEDRSALASLLAEGLVKRGGAGGPDVVELTFGCVREQVLRGLDDEARRLHHVHLATWIETVGLDDPDHLAEHLAEAGLTRRAGPPARLAADRAEHALAFERAARFHVISIDDPELEEASRRATRVRLGEALARTGRGRESADAFLAAGQGAEEAEWLTLRQRAAEELLITGHIEEGLAILRSVLEDVGLEAASSPWTALPSIAIESTRLALRGLDFDVCEESAWPRKLRMRADACLAAARALSIVDTITGAAFQLRALRLALELGDPYRVLYNVALGAGLAAANEGSRGTSADTHLAAAERTALLVHDPRGHAFVLMARGVVAYGRGEFGAQVAAMREGEHWLVTRCTYATWELNIVRIFLTLGLSFRGELSTLAQALAEYEHDADARGDVYAGSHFRLAARPWLSLASGDIEGGRAKLDAAMTDLRFDGYSWARYYGHVHRALFALHDGDVDAADESIKQIDALPGPILLARFRLHRLFARWVKGRTEVARLARRTERHAARKLRSIIDGIFEEGEPWADGLAHCLDSALCRLEGDEPLAAVALRAARDAFATAGMGLFEAAATHELAILTTDADLGPALYDIALADLAARGVREPASLSGLLAGIR